MATLWSCPLLQPRPVSLGVGRGGDMANIFQHLCHISKLIRFCTCIVGSLNKSTEAPIQTKEADFIDNIEKDADSRNFKMQGNYVEKINEDGSLIAYESYDFKEDTIKLFNLLKSLNISYRIEIYRPKHERQYVNPNIFYCKNLFLKDRASNFYLVIFHEDTEMDLKRLRKEVKACRNFSFATANELKGLLNVEQGGITPLALMSPSASGVRMVISNSLVREGATLMFHPLDSNLAVEVCLEDLLTFLEHVEHPVTFIK